MLFWVIWISHGGGASRLCRGRGPNRVSLKCATVVAIPAMLRAAISASHRQYTRFNDRPRWQRSDTVGVLEAREDANRALHGKDSMPLFYISEDNENDVQRCQESRLEGRPITITATDIDGKIAAFTGVVQSVAHDGTRKPGRRFSVTILPD